MLTQQTTEKGKVSFKSVIDGLWKVTQSVLGEIAVKEASKIEGVRKAVKSGGVRMGQKALWKYFPYIVGGVVVLLIVKFK